MILEEGNKVLVVNRRLFESDSARFFVGIVDGYEAGVAKVTGHTWVREQFGGHYVKKPDRRTKIVSVSSGTLLVYRTDGLDLGTAKLVVTRTGLTLTDAEGFAMDLNEGAEHVTARR